MLIQGIDTIIIRVSNLELSKKWYKDKLQLKPIWEDQNQKLVIFDTGGTTSLTIWQTDEVINSNKDTSSYPIFKTFDAFQLRQALIDKGVNTGDIIKDSSIIYFQFYDPDGNIFEACQTLP